MVMRWKRRQRKCEDRLKIQVIRQECDTRQARADGKVSNGMGVDLGHNEADAVKMVQCPGWEKEILWRR